MGIAVPADLVRQLQQRLTERSSFKLRSRMAPSLAYGRHRGPAYRGSRVAAVAIAMYRDAEQRWVIPLTKRPESLQHHGGQICLPGGRVEAGEANTLKREFVQVWRRDLAAEGPQVSEAHVVGNDKKDIRPIVDSLGVAECPDR